MLVDPGRSPWDLNFGLFGFRVRVHPFFWLFTGLFNSNLLQGENPELWLIWMVVVFVSILVHELGHAFAYRLFGSNASIVLYAFGGLAISNSVLRKRSRRIMVSLAGPFAGFIVAGLVYGSDQLTDWSTSRGVQLEYLYKSLFYVNLWWGIFNLFPVFPLDGGQVSRELCDGQWPGRGIRISLQISIWVAATVAIYGLFCVYERRSHEHDIPHWILQGNLYTAILFALLAYQSYQLYQQSWRGPYYEGPDDRLPWER